MTVTLQQLIEQLFQLYPENLAEEWDKVGLHFGHPNSQVNRVMTVLDVRPAVVDEAIHNGIDTIVSHHPLLMSPIKQFDLSDPISQMYAKLLQHKINVVAFHTNVDAAWNGMNDWLCEQLGLTEVRPLNQVTDENPGIGRIGQWQHPLTKAELLQLLKTTYHRQNFAVIEKTQKSFYKTVAIIGGSGVSYIDEVSKHNIDVFLTGDIKYHDAQVCEKYAFTTVDIGHYAEIIFNEKMAEVIDELIKQKQWSIDVQPSQENVNPFHYE